MKFHWTTIAQGILSSAERRLGSSRQGACLAMLPLLPAKHQSRSVVFTAQVGEGRCVLGGSCQMLQTSDHTCRRG